MYRKYVDQLDTQSEPQPADMQQQKKESEEDQWRVQWNAKPVEDLWASLEKQPSDPKGHRSLLKKHLTKEVYEKLKSKTTSLGGTLAQCMSSGEFIFILIFLFEWFEFVYIVFTLILMWTTSQVVRP